MCLAVSPTARTPSPSTEPSRALAAIWSWSLVWAAPMTLAPEVMTSLLNHARNDRAGLTGTMRCGQLEQGLVARYAGPSSRDARFWFSRIWARTRALRGLAQPRIPRVWPLQEQPLERQEFTTNPLSATTATH